MLAIREEEARDDAPGVGLAPPRQESIDDTTGMITDYDPLRGLFFY